jgi:hypothetical protein
MIGNLALERIRTPRVAQAVIHRRNVSRQSDYGTVERMQVSDHDLRYIFAADLDADRIMASWPALQGRSYRLHGMSLFGDLLLITSKGTIDMLESLSGECKQVAWCVEELEYEIGNEQGQRPLLMAPLADAAKKQGVRLAKGQCYAFRTPPILGGRLDPSNLVPWDIYAYHSGLPKLFAQIHGLPPGTQIIPRTGSGAG